MSLSAPCVYRPKWIAVSAHFDEIDHAFRSKPITRSDGNRSPVPTETDHLSERAARDFGSLSSGSSRFLPPRGLSHGSSFHVELVLNVDRPHDCSTVGRRARPVLFEIFR